MILGSEDLSISALPYHLEQLETSVGVWQRVEIDVLTHASVRHPGRSVGVICGKKLS